jgi:hypothetical protein
VTWDRVFSLTAVEAGVLGIMAAGLKPNVASITGGPASGFGAVGLWAGHNDVTGVWSET